MTNGVLRKIVLAVALSVFLFSGVMVLRYYLEMRAGAAYTESVAQMVVVPAEGYSEGKPVAKPTGQAAGEATQSAEGTTEGIIEEVVETPPIRVDFDALREKNKDVVAWIYCPDTPINYPVVQAADNEAYLHRLLDGSKNSAGTLFMDFRNSSDFSDWNSVIYGHNMKNGSMFGTLMDYKTQAYFDAHPKVFLLTPEQDYVINIVAGFVTPADAEIYNNFEPEEEKKAQLAKEWMAVSKFVSGNAPTEEDRLITLSTCSYEYNNARYVVLGILEKF